MVSRFSLSNTPNCDAHGGRTINSTTVTVAALPDSRSTTSTVGFLSPVKPQEAALKREARRAFEEGLRAIVANASPSTKTLGNPKKGGKIAIRRRSAWPW